MKILLVEDDESIQKVAKLSLERIGHHEVHWADNGAEALNVLESSTNNIPFDLVLMDLMMPVLDGYETCRRIKLSPQLQNIPIIVLTARAQVSEIRNAMSTGAIGYILKPFNPMTLPQEIENILNNAQSDRDPSGTNHSPQSRSA